MSGRWAVASAVAYVVLVGSAATPLYDPLERGDDDSWALVVVLVGAHVLAGVASGTAWVLLLPVAVAVPAFAIAGGTGLAWLILFMGLPVLLVAAAVGWLAGELAGPRRTVVAAAVLVVAAWPVAWASAETFERSRAEPLPASVQREIERGLHVASLCSRELPAGERVEIEAAARALVREARRGPGRLIAHTVDDAVGSARRETWTVEELAEDELRLLEQDGGDCARRLRERLRGALDAA